MTEPEEPLVDLRKALDQLDELREKLIELDGTPIPLRQSNRSRAGLMAALGRDLLYAGHLADGVRLAVLDQYFGLRRSD